jgi:hypothetical protein
MLPADSIAYVPGCSRLQLAKQVIVVGVRTDPEPDVDVAVAHGEGPMPEADARGVDRTVAWTCLTRRLGCCGFVWNCR